MKKIAATLLWVFFSVMFTELKAQENQPLFSLIYLKSGDVLTGLVQASNDSVLILDEWHLGRVTLRQKKIDRIESVMKDSEVMLTLGTNTRYTGYLHQVEAGKFILLTELAGEVVIAREEIKDIEIVKVIPAMGYNPNAARYFFAPSAIPIKKGRGYYQNAYLLSNSVSFGLSDHFTLGGGVVIPIFFYLTAKLSYKVKKDLYVGAGLIAASTFIPDATVSGGIPFGLITYGNEESNLTLGSGYGLLWDDEGEFQQTHYPITTLNGMIRLSNRLQLVSENWIIPLKRDKDYLIGGPYYYDNFLQDPVDPSDFDDFDGSMFFNAEGEFVRPLTETRQEDEFYMVMSLGLRILISQRSTVDFAPVYLHGMENAPIIPYLDFVYKF